MKRSLATILAVALFAQLALLGEADARKRKKKKKEPPPADKVAETEAPPANGEEATEENGAAAAVNGGGESKSITERLEDDGSEGALRSSRRMEFDERLVKGQAAKSGAVYLFKRIPRRLPGLVPLRRSYRRRIVEPMLGPIELKPARYSYEVVKEKKKKERKETLEEIKEAEEAADEATVNGKEAKPKEKQKSKAKSKSKTDPEALIEEIEE